MVTEIETALTPEAVIAETQRFFAEEDAVLPATIVEEGATYLTVATFRSRIAISAIADPSGGKTRVRVSTLRRNDGVGKLLTRLASAGAATGAKSFR